MEFGIFTRKVGFLSKAAVAAPEELQEDHLMIGDMSLRTFSTLIVIQNAIYREGLARILPQERFHVMLKISSTDNPILKEPGDLQPDLVIFDTASVDLARCNDIAGLHRRWPDARIVVLSDRHSQREIAAAFRAGVSAWIEHPNSHDALINIIDLVLAGETILISSQLNQLLAGDTLKTQASMPVESHQLQALPSNLDDVLSEDPPALIGRSKPHVPVLSDREKMIAAMLVSGYPNKVIARSIDVSEATVKVHIKSILRKIRVTNRTQAAIWATKNGFVGPEDRERLPSACTRVPVVQAESTVP